jgi:hypothetical protein
MKQFGYQHYTWFDLTIIGICLVALGVAGTAILVINGVL